ncbi:MAG: MarR family transcriptional regulator [Sphaerobacter sp.]|nr:MarR family transcriptional regulator [Sphaerobacter sp.]
MADSRATTIDAVLDRHRRITRALHWMAAPVWRDLDLTMAQMKILVTLAHEGPASISEIAAAQRISLPTASHLVLRLVEADLVIRAEDPTDRRRMVARLSPQGEELVARLRQGGCEQLRAWLEQLSDEDVAALLQGLTALAAVAERHVAAQCAADRAAHPRSPTADTCG